MSLSRNRLIAIAVGAVVLIVVGARACGGGDAPAPATSTAPAPVAQPAPTARPKAVSGGEGPDAAAPPPVVVPSGASPRPRERREPRVATPPKKRVVELPGGVARVAEQVTWPDARRVAQASAQAGEILASLYGRDADATLRTLRPLMSASALDQVRGRLREDPAPAGTPVIRARIVAINLENDPSTGSRTARVLFDYPSSAAGGLGRLSLEFSPTSPEIVGWDMGMLG